MRPALIYENLNNHHAVDPYDKEHAGDERVAKDRVPHFVVLVEVREGHQVVTKHQSRPFVE